MPLRTALVLLLASSACALAGPLDPPAGPVDSTGKTLTEVEPRTQLDVSAGATITIDEPGSYYLAGDLDVASGEGVLIRTGGVTLDLNGFTIRSNRTDNAKVSDIGVRIVPDVPLIDAGTITIRNGRVTDFFEGGVISETVDIHVTIEDVDTQRGTLGGIVLEGSASVRRCVVEGEISGVVQGPGFGLRGAAIIDSCTSFGHSGNGFQIREGVVRDSIARNLSADGFLLGAAASEERSVRLVNCVGRSNTGHGFRSPGPVDFEGCVASDNSEEGFEVDAISTFVDCRSVRNARDGFLSRGNSSFTGCTSRANGLGGTVSADGFDVGNNSVFLNCFASDNSGAGFEAGVSAVFTNCSADDNSGNGFETSRGSTITGCSSRSNNEAGYDLGIGSVVTGSNASSNGEDGFDLSVDGRISNCNAEGNGSAGIRADPDTAVDGNSVTGNVFGITASNGALVVRNAASGNGTNHLISGPGAAPVVSNIASIANPLTNIEY